MRGRAWALLAVLAVPAHAQEIPLEARNTTVVRDVDFGVSTRRFGLDRRVEMLQWQRVGEGYRRVWHDARIDSADYAPGHENPVVPLRSRRWWSDGARLRDRPLDAAVLRELGTWRGFRPDFAALPANLAVTFQPEGDGLGSAENPLEPVIGDMRVTWRELVLPPLDGKVTLQDGRWVLQADAPRTAEPRALRPVTAPAPPVVAPEPAVRRRWPWVAGVLGVGLLVLVLRGWRVRRATRARG